MTYLEYKKAFIEKHKKADWAVHTSPMDEYGQYVKNYLFTDGAALTEVNRPIYETVEAEVEVKGIKFTLRQQVKLMETEAWNTDDAKSVKFYERW